MRYMKFLLFFCAKFSMPEYFEDYIIGPEYFEDYIIGPIIIEMLKKMSHRSIRFFFYDFIVNTYGFSIKDFQI